MRWVYLATTFTYLSKRLAVRREAEWPAPVIAKADAALADILKACPKRSGVQAFATGIKRQWDLLSSACLSSFVHRRDHLGGFLGTRIGSFRWTVNSVL